MSQLSDRFMPRDVQSDDVHEGRQDEASDIDDDHSDFVSLKYAFDGLAWIGELSTSLRQFADDLERRVAEGWQLESPVDGGHVHLALKGEA